MQQINAAGAKRWATDYGLPVTLDPGTTSGAISASMAYNQVTGDIFCSFERVSLPVQSQWGVSVQKIDSAGNLAWGSFGTEVSPLDPNQEAFGTTVLGPDGGCYVIGFEGRATAGISVSGVVRAALVNAAGATVFSPAVTEVCSELLPKGRLWAAATPTGSAVLTFSNGSPSDLLLGNINADGTIGPPPVACAADLGATGGVPGQDGLLDNNDFIVFIDYFFAQNPVADVGTTGGVAGHDGAFDNNDFIVFIDMFFSGCN